MARRCATADDVARWVKETAEHGAYGQGGQSEAGSIQSIRSILYPEISANAALVLISVAAALLDRQVGAQASAFEQEGGFTERLYRSRRANRSTSS